MPNLTTHSNGQQWPLYVEDYITLLSGSGVFPGPQIKLASYDVQVLNSLNQQVNWEDRGLTERQAVLVLRLIEKYTRQMRNHGIDNSHVLDPSTRQYRLAIRKISREFQIYREGDQILVRFPYVQKLIDYIRIGRKNLDGSCEWDPDARLWRLGFTESNLSFVMTLATADNFQVDEDLLVLFEQLGQVEKQGYEIRLVETESGYDIENAAQSLRDYVQTHLGGFGADNLIRLVDHSGILSYTVAPEISEQVRAEHGENMLRLLTSHRNNIEPSSLSISEIYRYAQLTDRFPILIYCPNPSDQIIKDVFHSGIIDPEQIFQTGGRGRRQFDPDNHRVLFTKVLDRSRHVDTALKVSFHNMTYGANSMRWLSSPGKIVYYCTELIPRE